MNDTPYNAFTGVEYKGYNVMFLNMALREKGYKNNKWATFLDWKKNGYNVLKGEKSVHCRTFIEDVKKKGTAVKYFCLFNIEQVEKVETKEVSATQFIHDNFVMA